MTITQEQLITQAREEVAFWRERDEVIPSQQTAIRLRLAEITLAALTALAPDIDALTAEPVAWRWNYGGSTNFRFQDSEPRAGDNPKCRRVIQALYAAPPAPVSVPETLPCPVMLEPGLRFGKGVRTQTMLDALQRRAEYSAELEAMTPEQRSDHEAGMKEFAAMLQGNHRDLSYPVDPQIAAYEKIMEQAIPDGGEGEQ